MAHEPMGLITRHENWARAVFCNRRQSRTEADRYSGAESPLLNVVRTRMILQLE
jgi:hypothetical protein